MAEPEEDDSALEPGTVLEDRYRLVEPLGQGGVGSVFRAEDLRLGTMVAVKMLHTSMQAHPQMRPRFEREARALASLRHPHIVTIIDYSVVDGRPYLVLELLEGQPLNRLMRGDRFLPPEKARRIALAVLDALIFAHGQGFAHRDLKPSNIFLVRLPTEPEFVKLLDFGFVKFHGVEPTGDAAVLTRSGIAFGTPGYMSPEQATGGETDLTSDLYSLGIILYEMLAGRRPFRGAVPDILRDHLVTPVPSLEGGPARVVETDELRAFLERAMAKRPSERFGSAGEMKEALLALPRPMVRAIVSVSPSNAPSAPNTEVLSLRDMDEEVSAPDPLGDTITPARIDVGSAAGAGPPPSAERRDTESGASVEDESAAPGPPGRRGGWLTALAILAALTAGAWFAYLQMPEVRRLVEDLVGDGMADPEGEAGPGEASGPTGAGRPAEGGAGGPGGAPTYWDRHPPSGVLARARERLRRSESGLPMEEFLELRAYVRDHRRDPRGHLLMGRHFFLKEEDDLTAIGRYEIAWKLDPDARTDPNVLPDLVVLAGRGPVAERAEVVLVDMFGTAARPAVLAYLDEHGDELEPEDRDRLEALADSLIGP